MPTIDPRLLPLIETLVATGADWLAFEIVDGIRSGRPTEDSDEEVRAALRAVRSSKQYESAQPESMAVKPLIGDDQIEFAAAYVVDRLSHAIYMASLSIEQLDNIVFRSQTGSAPTKRGDGDSVRIDIRLEDSDMVLKRVQAQAAQDGLAQLTTALSDWSQAVRHGERQE